MRRPFQSSIEQEQLIHLDADIILSIEGMAAALFSSPFSECIDGGTAALFHYLGSLSRQVSPPKKFHIAEALPELAVISTGKKPRNSLDSASVPEILQISQISCMF